MLLRFLEPRLLIRLKRMQAWSRLRLKKKAILFGSRPNTQIEEKSGEEDL